MKTGIEGQIRREGQSCDGQDKELDLVEEKGASGGVYCYDLKDRPFGRDGSDTSQIRRLEKSRSEMVTHWLKAFSAWTDRKGQFLQRYEGRSRRLWLWSRCEWQW